MEVDYCNEAYAEKKENNFCQFFIRYSDQIVKKSASIKLTKKWPRCAPGAAKNEQQRNDKNADH